MLEEEINIEEQEEPEHFLKRLRDRIVNQGMEPLIEAIMHIEHPEDMLINDGSRGGLQAIDLLKELPSKAQDITIKWDGRPAIVFGRDKDGNFVLTDKSGFTAKTYSGMAKSPEELEKVMQMRGGDRTELINMYKALWKPLEAQTPKGLDGFFQADMMYIGTPKKKGNNYVFTPNTVTYSVGVDTDLGKRMSSSQAGIAVHTYMTGRGDAQPYHDISIFGEGPIVFLGPKMKETPQVDVPTGRLDQIESKIKQNSRAIDKFFMPVALQQNRISNLPALIKQYANFKVREGNFNNMAGNFLQWVETKVTPQKYGNIENYLSGTNIKVLELIFNIYSAIAVIKTQIVRALDKQGGGISASINGEEGQEGYVQGGLKLVDRFRFSRSNFAKNLQ